MGPVHGSVRNGTYSEWLYKLHEKVNQKLRRQHLESTVGKWAMDASAVQALVSTPTIQYDTLRKRLDVMRPYFSCTDVCTVLGIMLLNGLTAGNENRLPYVFAFVTALGHMLVASNTFPALGMKLQSLTRDCCDTSIDATASTVTSPAKVHSELATDAATTEHDISDAYAKYRTNASRLLAGVCELQLQRTATAEDVSSFTAALGAAKALACSVGTCQ